MCVSILRWSSGAFKNRKTFSDRAFGRRRTTGVVVWTKNARDKDKRNDRSRRRTSLAFVELSLGTTIIYVSFFPRTRAIVVADKTTAAGSLLRHNERMCVRSKLGYFRTLRGGGGGLVLRVLPSQTCSSRKHNTSIWFSFFLFQNPFYWSPDTGTVIP